MIRLKGFGLKDVLTFEDTELTLGQESGLYIVAGKNLDSRIKDNTNAVGKSRLFSAIPTAAFETDPLALKKRNKKDILKSKGSVHILEVENHQGQHYRFEQSATAYKIFKHDGKELVNINQTGKAVKLEIARTHLETAFPMTEAMFYATCYISDQRNCGFLKATPKERLSYITDLFGLDIYDQLRKIFTKQLGDVAKTEIEFKTLAQELKTKEDKLGSVKWGSKQATRLRKLKTELDAIRSELNSLYEKIGTFNQAKKNVERYEKLTGRLAELKTKLKGIDPTQSTLDSLQKDYKSAAASETYFESLDEYKTEIKAIDRRLAKLSKPSASTDELAAEYEKLIAIIPKLERDVNDSKEANDEYLSAKAQNEEHKKKANSLLTKFKATRLFKDLKLKSDFSALVPHIEALRTTVALWDQIQDHDHLNGCPVCGSSIKLKDLKLRVANAKQHLSDFEIYLKYLSEIDHIVKVKAPKIDIEISKKLTKAKARLKTVKAEGINAEEYEGLVEERKKLRKPIKPKRLVKTSSAKLESTIQLLTEFLQIKTRLKDLGSENYDANTHKKLSKQVAELNSKSNAIESEWRKLNLARIEHDTLQESVNELSAKLSEIAPILEKRNQLKHVQAAYSPNNLKLQAAETIVRRLEDSLNRYSALVFLEPMKFQIRTQKDGISAIVTRNNGETSDIVYLSGAEANCFRMLFAVSLLPLIPEEKRTNFMILDEPDSRCSVASRGHLIREFIPILRQIVPHVFWITPKSIDDFHDYRLLTIVKEKGSSRMEVSGGT